MSPPDYQHLHSDVVLLAVTSQPQANDTLRISGWRAAGLPKPSWVKPVIGTFSVELVDRRIGSLARADYDAAIAAFSILSFPVKVDPCCHSRSELTHVPAQVDPPQRPVGWPARPRQQGGLPEGGAGGGGGKSAPPAGGEAGRKLPRRARTVSASRCSLTRTRELQESWRLLARQTF